MEFFIIFVFFVIYCFVIAGNAKMKGRSYGGWFFLSLILSPLLAFFALILVGEKKEVDKIAE